MIRRNSLDAWPSSLWAGVMLGMYCVIVLPSMGQPLLENHAYRQTQTAYTAVLFARDGFDFLAPPLPVLGPPGTVPQEFPLFQALGAIGIRAGLAPDLAMRVVGVATFLLSAVLLFLVARRLLSETGALVALGAFLFNPHALLYGRTSLIEYLATAGGLAFLLFAIRFMDSRRLVDWGLALLGAVGMLLVKVTTGPVFLLPVLALRSRSGRWGFRRPGLWAMLLVSVAIGLTWNQYANSVRASNPATAFLAAENAYDWFFGSVHQRLDLAEWRRPLAVMLALTGSGLVVWALIAARFASGHPQRGFLFGLLLAIVAPILVLFNLYSRHDYYYSALAPFTALAIGMGSQQLLQRPRTKLRRRVLVGLAGAWVATFIGMYGSWSVIYGTPGEQARVFEAAAFIQEHSSPDDWVVVEGFGWNSTFLYYARRRGFADPGSDNLLQPGEVDVDAILEDPVYGPFFTCDSQGQCTVSQAH